MEHKSYTLEIVLELLRKNGHARELARMLGTSHMNVSRKLKQLLKENAVDYAEEGKNKTYYLKDSTEARAYVLMSENYRIAQTVKRYPALRGMFERIQHDSRIRLAILFGSYAKGIAKADSDIDIFIETTDTDLKRDIEMMDSRLSVKIGGYDKSSLLIKEIEQNHVIIKGVERYYSIACIKESRPLAAAFAHNKNSSFARHILK